MKRLTTGAAMLGAICVFMFASGTAAQQEQPGPICTEPARGMVKQATAPKRWRRGIDRAKLARVADCVPRRFVKKRKAAFRRYRLYREVATVKCTPGKWGYWADIGSDTCQTIGCESGFSWGAANPSSSARGPYQLLDIHPRPWPVRGFWDKLAHHRIADYLSPSAWNFGC